MSPNLLLLAGLNYREDVRWTSGRSRPRRDHDATECPRVTATLREAPLEAALPAIAHTCRSTSWEPLADTAALVRTRHRGQAAHPRAPPTRLTLPAVALRVPRWCSGGFDGEVCRPYLIERRSPSGDVRQLASRCHRTWPNTFPMPSRGRSSHPQTLAVRSHHPSSWQV